MVFLISLLAAAVAFAVHLAAKKRYSKSEATFAGVGTIVALIIALLQVFTVIPAGSVGVVDFLGMVSDNTLKAGVNLVNPLANVVKFSVKTQEVKENMSVPSKEGLSIQLEISVLYSLNPENASRVYKTLGENYAEIILVPQFRSVVRGITSAYEAKALYTSQREELANAIQKELSKLVNPRGITVEAVPLRQIVLPAGLTASIEEKLKAEQESQRMEFVLKKEAQEAERKRIEAKGIADFQAVISKGITSQLLKWKGIEATEKLANSQNSKVIVIGSGKEGLPVILGNDK
ncbi:MAG: prohibitin family protein [Ignavibacteria bacterium]|jgi:regulator of protease activity HflC (stomatin/prohibitin superfamily)|nr:prohibitin family protein [Ignavibacteria bacterium]MCU7503365.1 prohibitin family protein [Ignavibacteria bacterium]MCU7515689.1 prohibitin family protein [Ignavibacteria bacterium]